METQNICERCGQKRVFLLTTWACPTYRCGADENGLGQTGTVITTGTASTLTGMEGVAVTSNTITLKNCWVEGSWMEGTEKPLPRSSAREPNGVCDPPHASGEVTRSVDGVSDPTKLVIHDWTASSLYSTLEIDSEHEGSLWHLFDYSRSQPIPESGALASSWHTNVPRQGSFGLPRGWAAVVNGWRVTCDWSFANPAIREWAKKTTLCFFYRNKPYYQIPLGDFIGKGYHGSGAPTVDSDLQVSDVLELTTKALGLETVEIRENLDYGVSVESCPKATARLRDYLAGYWMDQQIEIGVDLTPYSLAQSGVPSPRDRLSPFRSRKQDFKAAMAKLDTIISMLGTRDNTSSELRKVRSLLVPSATLSLRVHLNCALRKEVV